MAAVSRITWDIPNVRLARSDIWKSARNAGLADTGVHAGNLTIGGLIERGDIHQLMVSHSQTR